MYFNFRLFFRVLYKSLIGTAGTNAQLTPRRVAVLLVLAAVYTVVESCNWLCLALDRILFPGYRSQEIESPVFIIGVPRSGTTFLHRLLTRDQAHFTSMRFWEVAFAPSVVQKKVCGLLGRLDARIGRPITRLIQRFERDTMGDLVRIHRIGFFEAEEDVWLLFHIFSSALLVFVFPFAEDLWPYFYPDGELDARERGRMMAFYKACVQRHLYARGGGRRFLSKNPVFSGMVESLNETFPDARFVCMVRSPLEVVPSVLSLYRSYGRVFFSPCDPAPMQEAACRIIALYYRYPLERLALLPDSRQMVIVYDTLLAELEATVRELYRRCSLALTPSYAAVLRREQEKALRYRSAHRYSIEEFGLTRARIVEEYHDIFERFGFDRQEADG